MTAARAWEGRVIETPRLRLRPPCEADIPALVELAGDWEVSRHTGVIPHPYGEDDARTFLAAATRKPTTGTGIDFAIERRTAPGLIGCAGFLAGNCEANPEPEPEIGYWLGRPHWGQGFATEALDELLRLMFGSFDFTKVRASVLDGNEVSCRVLEKTGFDRLGAGTGARGRCKDRTTVEFTYARDDWLKKEAARPTLFVVAAALVDADGRVLMAQRLEGSSMAGLWEFPGGKVRAGETPEAALVRELREEIGIDITGSCLAPFTFASHAYANFHLLMPLYVCRVWKGEVTSMEGQKLKWVRPNQMRDLPMPPADIPLVAMLRDLLQ
ncbi:MAG: GNAT family N-acetyltransferase [Rhodospirillales bacterium]|nr:GNAT family N-acetyltransferase [Rhodospirillales bacterium]